MPAYGHTLRFGVFLTPSSDNPDEVVGLAELAEQAGLDLVTFQDHPYQVALDTWTLLSWVAGRTQRVRLAANVLNLPLRQPAVMARSAASLDLLSGGRLELGIGAGAYWQAIEAMGGPRLDPGQAVDGLDEALDIIRAIWDTNERSAVTLDGEVYRVSGATRGPTPAHDIPIHIGGSKPRMLRLVGRKADGWIVSLPYLQPGQLESSNAIIDAAAREAERDPREIQRLLNISGRFSDTRCGFLDGPPEAWVADLLSLAVEQGVSAFILMTDDSSDIERFATEVAPQVREALRREYPELQHATKLRRAAVRSMRRAGIDYDRIPTSLAGDAVEPGDIGYVRFRSNYLRGGAPGLILRPGNVEEVAEALAYARSNPDVPLGIRSGGHGISGRSTNNGGIVIDMGKINGIEIVDPATRRVRLGPGARWGDVAAALAPHGWALSSGDYGGVGVGGLATAGGIGWLVREHGLTIDHLRAAEVVLADGSLVRASEDEHSDLFWAVRGAGANFGIVTAFELEADVVGDVGWAQLVIDASDTAGLLQRWGAAVETAPRDLTSFLIVGPPRGGQPALAYVLAVVDSNQPETIIDRVQPLADVGPLYNHQVVITPYASIMGNAQGGIHDASGDPAARSGLIEHITPEFAAAAARLIHSRVVYYFQIRAVGGAVSDVDPDATAYAHRAANFHVTAFGSSHARLNQLWDDLHHHFDGIYLSFDTDPRPERINDAFPPRTLERLRAVKERYDPENVFRDNFNVAPRRGDEFSLEGT